MAKGKGRNTAGGRVAGGPAEEECSRGRTGALIARLAAREGMRKHGRTVPSDGGQMALAVACGARTSRPRDFVPAEWRREGSKYAVCGNTLAGEFIDAAH